MNEITPGGDDDAPLSLSEAAAAYATEATTEEPEEGQPEVEDDEQGLEADDDELASDEDDEESEEGEPDEDGQAEDEAEGEPDSDQGRFVSPNGKVTLPDGTVATVADLIQGNLRDRDYRQKTMELAESRKAVEAKSSAFAQQEQELTQQREFMTKLLHSIVPAEPDVSMLQTDPMGYMSQKASRDQWVQYLNHLTTEQQQAAQASQAKTEAQRREKADTEWKALLEKAPELKDDGKLKGFVADLNKFGAEYGFSADEIRAQVPFDHRLALVMSKAIKWDKFQASKGKVQKKVESRPPVMKGSQRLDPQRAKSRNARVAMDRLNTSGKLADGVAALLAIEGKG